MNQTTPIESLLAKSAPQLTVFFDGYCPLCVNEMKQLRQHDKHGALSLVDINGECFNERFPEIDKAKASQVLHGKTKEGEILLGLDTTYRAWSLVNKHGWLRYLRLPVIRVIADWFYLIFARNRYRFSYLLTGKSRCESCQISAGDSKSTELKE